MVSSHVTQPLFIFPSWNKKFMRASRSPIVCTWRGEGQGMIMDPGWGEGEGGYTRTSNQPLMQYYILWTYRLKQLTTSAPDSTRLINILFSAHTSTQPTNQLHTQPVIFTEPAHTESNRNISTNQPEGKKKQKCLTVHLWECPCLHHTIVCGATRQTQTWKRLYFHGPLGYLRVI